MKQTEVVLVGPMNWGDPVARDGEFLLPAGTVTMLLADVEGSSRRWEEDETSAADEIAALSRLVDQLIGRHNGVRPLEQGEGDSFVAAFSLPSEAVACALEISRSAKLPLRIGLHSGEAERTESGTYVGPTLNRAGRLRDAAHGGQIVLSQATADLVIDRLTKESSLRELGTFRLRDLSRAERIFQLVHADLRTDFPALRTLDTYRHNLPPQRTSFFGRHEDMAKLVAVLDESHLVTLTGAGGCGKTRLAVQLGADLVDDYPDGVFFADLSVVSDADDVPRAVARALGMSEEAGSNVAAFVRAKTSLVILDNCEHVIGAVASLADSILAGARSVDVLATSREPLRIAGEVIYVVPSLPVPPADGARGIDGLEPFAAAELFLDRARRVRSGFVPSEDDAAAVAAICRRLDGIPLAIELAAARVRALSPRQIADGLDERFSLLTGGARTAMARQQTLLASVDWSHDLLTDPERVVLRRLAVFPGGFSLPAASTVASCGEGVAVHQVLDLVSLLVDKSLVEVETTEREARYRLLETIRQYALVRLRAAGEEDDARRAHRDHYLDLAEWIGEEVWGPAGVEAFETFLEDRENLEAAFRMSIGLGHMTEAARLAIALAHPLGWIWAGEAAAWLMPLLPSADTLPEPVRTDLLYSVPTGLGLRSGLGDMVTPSVDHHTSSGDELRLGRALITQAMCARGGDIEGARAIAQEGLQHLDTSAPAWERVVTRLAIAQGELIPLVDLRRRLVDEAEPEVDRLGGPLARAVAAHWLYLAHYYTGQPRRALDAYERWYRPLQSDLARLPTLYQHFMALVPAILWEVGRAEEGEALVGDLLPGRVAAGDVYCASLLQSASTVFAVGRGDGDTALALADDMVAAVQDLQIPWEWPLLVRLMVRLNRGEIESAAHDLASIQNRDDWFHKPLISIGEAVIAFHRSDPDAEMFAHRALAAAFPNSHATVATLDILAAIAAVEGRAVDAARILGALESYTQEIGHRMTFPFAIDRERAVATVRDALGPDAFEEARGEGAVMKVEEIIGYLQRGRGERGRPSYGWASLTPTELRVAAFVAEGLPNAEIATHMFISVRTVTTHLTHIYTKLGVASRTQLATIAVGHNADD